MNSSLARSIVALLVSCLLPAVAYAQPDEPRGPEGPCVECEVAQRVYLVPDVVLRTMRGRDAIYTLSQRAEVGGTLLSFDAESVTLAEAGTGRVFAVPRAELISVRIIVPRAMSALTVAPPMKERHWGLQVSQGVGNVLLDLDYGHFYGFVGTSIGYPILFTGGSGDQFFAFAVGAGVSWKMSAHSLWKFDLVGTLTPTWWGGFSAGIGVAAGFHYTSPSGFTVGFKIPVLGVAPGCNTVIGSSNNDYSDGGGSSGCSRVSGGPALIGNYFMQAGMSLPVVSLGYRF